MGNDPTMSFDCTSASAFARLSYQFFFFLLLPIYLIQPKSSSVKRETKTTLYLGANEPQCHPETIKKPLTRHSLALADVLYRRDNEDGRFG